MRGFSSRTWKNSSARAALMPTMNAAAARDNEGAARRPRRRGAAPRIRSNLGAAHSQLDGGDDEDDSYGSSNPCLCAGKKSTGVDQMPYAGDRSAAGIIHNTALIRPHVLREVERHLRKRGQSPAYDLTHLMRPEEYPLEDVEQMRRQYGPEYGR